MSIKVIHLTVLLSISERVTFIIRFYDAKILLMISGVPARRINISSLDSKLPSGGGFTECIYLPGILLPGDRCSHCMPETAIFTHMYIQMENS